MILLRTKTLAAIVGLSLVILAPSLASAYVFNPSPTTTPITGDITPPYISLLSVSNITSTGATMTWSTNEPADTQVEFCLSYIRCGVRTPLDSTMSTQHVVNIIGMSPGTFYNVWPLSKDAAGNIAASYPKSFYTPSVTDTIPPTIYMTAPTDGANVRGYTVGVSANASDNIGVHSVTFYRDNGIQIGFEDSTLPYLAYINTYNLTPGAHTLYAIATDAARNSTRSAPITVYVVTSSDTTPPFISLVALSNINSTGVTISWTTNELADTQAEYCTSYIECGTVTPLSSTMTTQHVAVVNGLNPGTFYNIWPKSKDAAGNVAASYPKSFYTPSTSDTIPPTVSMTAPADGANVVGYTVGVSANASDNIGVHSVTFYRDGGIQIGFEDSTLPYLTYINTYNLTPGAHTLYAIATDNGGNATRSAPITVYVVPPPDVTAPYVSLVAVSNLTQTSATLTWTTNEPADTQIEVCTSYIRCGNNFIVDPSFTTQHVVNINGLTPGTYYNVWAKSVDVAGNLGIGYPRAFTTPR